MSDERDPIDRYLDELLARLRGSSTDVRRILTETEQHLREGASALEAEGNEPPSAQREAIHRFGKPREVASQFRRLPGWLPPFPTLAQLTEKLALLAAIGLIAIGVSGGIAALFGATFGKSFMAGDVPGVTYTPARCADFLEYFPKAGSCEKAATAHHFDEVVSYRLAAGVLGVMALVGFLIVRRFNRRRYGDAMLLPEGFVGIVGAAVFGLAAAGLLFLGIMPVIFGQTESAGQYLSGGIVSLLVFAVFGAKLLRSLRERSSTLDDNASAND